jgi:hypothetical protein
MGHSRLVLSRFWARTAAKQETSTNSVQEGGHKFLRYVGLSPKYTALQLL